MDKKTIGLLAHFLSLPVEGEFPDIEAMPAPQRRDRTLAALVEYVHRRAKCQPVLCVFEDVHWADPSTKELLSRLVESIEDQRVFVVVTSRPGFEAAIGRNDTL